MSSAHTGTHESLSDELAALLHQCRQGDPRAWRGLFEANFAFVHNVARRLGTPPGELDDVCQEVFLVVFRRLDQFTYGRFTTWLYRITANVVHDRLRRRLFRDALARLFGREPERPNPVPSAQHQVEHDELRRQIGEVLAAMKPKKREVFALYELEGLSGEEIAERVGCSVNNVWARLHHARKEFARLARKRGLIAETSVNHE